MTEHLKLHEHLVESECNELIKELVRRSMKNGSNGSSLGKPRHRTLSTQINLMLK